MAPSNDIDPFHIFSTEKSSIKLAEQIRTAEAAGLKEISLIPGLDYARDTARDFMEKVVPLV